jgi:hypothetical protein
MSVDNVLYICFLQFCAHFSHNMQNDNTSDKSPEAYRWIENGHILIWLLKDTCWALEYKTLAVIMIVPAIAVAFYILWRSRGMKSEFYHSLAVCFWIIANSVWMLGEFNDIEARPLAASLFICGLLVLGIYYIPTWMDRLSPKK